MSTTLDILAGIGGTVGVLLVAGFVIAAACVAFES